MPAGAAAAAQRAQAAPQEAVPQQSDQQGQQGDGGGRGRAAVTPAGWRVEPTGREFGVSKLASGFQGPLGEALSPDGRHVLTTSSGAARIDSVDLFDINRGVRSDFVPYDALQAGGPAVFYGIVFSPDGRRAWASGGGQNVVHSLSVKGDRLTETGQIATAYFPAGLAYGHTPRGDRLYVANNLSAASGGAAGNPPGHQVTVIDPHTNAVTSTIELGSPTAPLGVAFSADGRRAFITNWLGRSVAVLDTATETKIGEVQLSPQTDPLQADHPSAITANPRRGEVYTANANSDTVSVLDSSTGALLATIDVALVPGGRKGAQPVGLTVSPDGGRLYVAEAGENALAVVDLARRQTLGFMPTAWSPSDVKVTPDGRRLIVLNMNDSGAGPNPCGPLTPRTGCPAPDPQRDAPGRLDWQYSGSMIKGSIQVAEVPHGAGQLRRLSEQVRSNNQAEGRLRPKPGYLDAIKHVIYVVKENRTYDQVFGDLGRGNGDPSLALFKDDAAPNQRALARQFTTIDNFFADAEVSASGHNWIAGATSTDYVQKTWPINYSPSPRGAERAYDFEDVPLAQQFATEPLAGDPSVPRSGSAATGGYLWDDAAAHGVSYRDYGEFTQFGQGCSTPTNTSSTTHLAPRFGDHVDAGFPGYNLACSDHTQREPEWQREFAGYVANGNLPALQIVRLPSDHTQGTRPGQATPASYVADNDLALGRLVEAVSHSPYWSSTAILVTEDDAQNGPDHVDAHRTVALAISPYTQRGAVDHTHYDTSSMLGTAEELLGLPPMSITDSRVNRMWSSFGPRPSLAPYETRLPTVVPFGDPGAPLNTAASPMAATARTWPIGRRADSAPEDQLNQSIWKSVKGARSRMPAPRHTIVGEMPNGTTRGEG
ncbi:MAG: alkaline phosphatase family protein [Solirubrobacteraceae bacterium]